MKIKACGLGRYNQLLPSYLRGVHGVVLICDVTDTYTFDQTLDLWISEVRKNSSEDTPILLVGNKLDAIQLYATGKDFHPHEIGLVNGYFRRYCKKVIPSCLIHICLQYSEIPKRINTDKQISYQEAKNFADKYKLDYIETSAKTGYNVEKAMERMAYMILKKKRIDNLPPMNVKDFDGHETKSTSLLHETDSKKSHESCCQCKIL